MSFCCVWATSQQHMEVTSSLMGWVGALGSSIPLSPWPASGTLPQFPPVPEQYLAPPACLAISTHSHCGTLGPGHCRPQQGAHSSQGACVHRQMRSNRPLRSTTVCPVARPGLGLWCPCSAQAGAVGSHSLEGYAGGNPEKGEVRSIGSGRWGQVGRRTGLQAKSDLKDRMVDGMLEGGRQVR